MISSRLFTFERNVREIRVLKYTLIAAFLIGWDMALFKRIGDFKVMFERIKKKAKSKINDVQLDNSSSLEETEEAIEEACDICEEDDVLGRGTRLMEELMTLEATKKASWKETKISLKMVLILCVIVAFTVWLTDLLVMAPDPDIFKFVVGIKRIEKHLKDDYYFEAPDQKTLYEGAYRGFVDALGSDYNRFLNADEAASWLGDEAPMFGVGCTVRSIPYEEYPDRFCIQIAEVEENSPMQEAGFLPDDVITVVNSFASKVEYNGEERLNDNLTVLPMGIDTLNQFVAGLGDIWWIGENEERQIWFQSNWDKTYAASSLSWQQKNEAQAQTVYVKVVRQDEKGEWFEHEAVLTKRKLPARKTLWKMLDESTGYIRIKEFTKGASEEVATALDKLKQQGMKKLVLDLRFNPGGILGEVDEIATRFIKKGTLYKICQFGRADRLFAATGTNFKTNVKMAVLVNENTASAAEQLAAILKAQQRGILVGTKTYGKGIFQSGFPMPDGAYLSLVTGEQKAMPGEVVINNIGVQPDVVVEGPPLEAPGFAKLEYDEQLRTALEQLQ